MKQKILRLISKLAGWLLNRKQPPTQQNVYCPKKIINKNVTTVIIIIDSGNKHA